MVPKFWVAIASLHNPSGSTGPYHTWPAPKEVSKWVQNSTEKRCIASYLFSLIIFIFHLLLLQAIKITLVKYLSYTNTYLFSQNSPKLAIKMNLHHLSEKANHMQYYFCTVVRKQRQIFLSFPACFYIPIFFPI